MDQNRLKEVHQTDLIEGRINEDFVDWLKTKGPTWLLMILIGVGGYLAIVRWKQHKTQHFVEAWVALSECTLPGAFEDVAERYADVPGLPQEAKRAGAGVLLSAVVTGRPLTADPDPAATAPPMSEQERLEYLARAERLYREVLEDDDLSLAMTLHAVNAMQGVAVIAESRGDIAEARTWYENAAQRAEPFYPQLAKWARQRSETADQYAEAVSLPTRAALPSPPPTNGLEPATIDESLRGLLLPGT